MRLNGNPIKTIQTSLLTDTAALKVVLKKRGPDPPGPGYLAGPDQAARAGDVASTQTRNIVSSALVGTYMLNLSGKQFDALPAEIRNDVISSLANGDGGTVGGRIKKLAVPKTFAQESR